MIYRVGSPKKVTCVIVYSPSCLSKHRGHSFINTNEDVSMKPERFWFLHWKYSKTSNIFKKIRHFILQHCTCTVL